MPGHWRSTPAFADSDGPLLYRTPLRAPAPRRRPAPLAHPRRALLPRRRLARRRLRRRHRGLLRTPHPSRSPSCSPPRAEHVAGGRGRVPAAARQDGQAQPHRRLPALGLPRRHVEPRRHLAARARRGDRPGPHPRPPRAVPRGDRRERARSCCCGANLETAEPATVVIRSTRRRRRPRAHPAARRRREPRRVDRRRSSSRRCGGRGRSATSRSTTWWSRSRRPRRRDERQPPADVPHRPSPGRAARLDLLDQRRAPLPQGLEPRAHPAGAGRGHARRARRGRPAGQGGRPRPAPHPRPRHPARALRRRRRGGPAAVAGPAPAVGLRPQRAQAGHRARPTPPSASSATTRRSRSGAGTTSPRHRRHRRRRRPRRAGSGRRPVLRRHGAADVQPDGPRPGHRQDAPQGRRQPPGRPPLGRAGRTCPSSTAPTPTSTSAGTTAPSATSRASSPPCPRMARFVTEFGAQAVPDTADFMEPERWPDLDWERLAARHRIQKAHFDKYVPAGRPRHLRRLARRDASATKPLVIERHIRELRRIKYRPTVASPSSPSPTPRRSCRGRCSTTNGCPSSATKPSAGPARR